MEGSPRRRAACWLAPAATLIVVQVATGVAMDTALRTTAIVAVQVATGAACWRLARREVTACELLGFGLALGSLAAMVAHQLLRATALADWAWAVPAALVATVTLARRDDLAPIRSSPRAETVAVAVGIGVGLLWLVPFFQAHPLHWSGWWAYEGDVPYHEAITRSVSGFGPTDSVFTAGRPWRYHWFAHAWAGALTDAADAGPFVVLTRVLPVTAIAGASALAATWAGRLGAVRWVPTTAVVLLVGGGYVGVTARAGDHVPAISPPHALSLLWLLAASIVVTDHLRGRLPARVALPTAGVLAVACVGGKVSHALVLGGGLVVVLAVAIRTGAAHRRAAWHLTTTCGAVIVAAFALVLAGAGSAQAVTLDWPITAAGSYGLEPFGGPIGVGIGAAILALAIVPRWAGAGVLAADAAERHRPEVVYAAGAAGIGLLVTVVFRHEGGSELYFVLSGSALATVVSACGLGISVPRMPARARALAVVAGVLAGGAATALVLGADRVIGLRDVRWAIPPAACAVVVVSTVLIARRTRSAVLPALVLALVVSSVAANASGWASLLGSFETHSEPGAPRAWTMAHRDAAEWLADASDPRDVIATNRLCSDAAEQAPSCSDRWFLVGALTGRRAYIEGYDYGVGLGELPPWAQRRVRLSLEIADAPTTAARNELWHAGVRWVWVDPAVTDNRSWDDVAEIVYSNDVAIVLRLLR